jgi:hypothetical protein
MTVKLHMIPDRWYSVANHLGLLAVDGFDTYRIGKEAFFLPHQPHDLGQLRAPGVWVRVSIVASRALSQFEGKIHE